MVAIPSVNEVMSQVKGAATQTLAKDITLVVGYSEYQLNHIAQHTVLLAKAAEAGAFSTDEDQKEFIDGLQDMIHNFLVTLQGLVMLTIEKLWNAVVKVLWGILGKAMNVVLPVPQLPQI